MAAEIEHFPKSATPKIIACANERSIVVTDDNTIYSFGQGLMGELGLGYVTQVSFPEIITKIPTGLNWIQVACGTEHTIALVDNGEIWAWGANEMGQLGLGHSKMVDRPTKVLSSEKFTQISCGASHSIALTAYGEIFTWGGSYMGQSGNQAQNVDFTVPTKVEKLESEKDPLPTFKYVTSGDYCCAAVSMTGDLWTWGAGGHGRLGLGNTITWMSPQIVKDVSNVKQVSVCANHMLAVDDTGKLYSWGAAHNGELGTGRRLRELRPVLIDLEERFINVQAGYEFSLAISEQGSLYGWGSCANGVLGNGKKVGTIEKPKKIKKGNIVWRSIITHKHHVLGIGQGSSSPPDGWSFQDEIIDPDSPMIQEGAVEKKTEEKAEKNVQ